MWEEVVNVRFGLTLFAVEASVWQWRQHSKVVEKSVRDLETHGFPPEEVVAFTELMEQRVSALVESGRRVFDQRPQKLVLCGRQVEISVSSLDDTWRTVLYASMCFVAINSGVLKPLVWERHILSLEPRGKFPHHMESMKVPEHLVHDQKLCREVVESLLAPCKTYEECHRVLMKQKETLLSLDPLFWVHMEFVNTMVASVVLEKVKQAFLEQLPTNNPETEPVERATLSEVCKRCDDIKALPCVPFCGWHAYKSLESAAQLVKDIEHCTTHELIAQNVVAASPFHREALARCANFCTAEVLKQTEVFGKCRVQHLFGRVALDHYLEKLRTSIREGGCPTMDDVKVLRQFGWMLTSAEEREVNEVVEMIGKRRRREILERARIQDVVGPPDSQLVPSAQEPSSSSTFAPRATKKTTPIKPRARSRKQTLMALFAKRSPEK